MATSTSTSGDEFGVFQDDEEVFISVFKAIDSDGNGRITSDELDAAIAKEEHMGVSGVVVGFRSLKELVESSGAEGITLDQFTAAAAKLPRLSGQRVHWAQGLRLERALSKHLPPGALFDGLRGLREMSEADLIKACGAFSREIEGVVMAEWTRLRGLNSAQAAGSGGGAGGAGGGPLDPHGDKEIRSAMSKFVDSGGFMGKFGDAELFHTGLEKELGYPNPDILKTILREHQSTEFFVTSNYGLATSDFIEFVRLFMVEDSKGQQALPFLKEMSEAGGHGGPDKKQVKEIEAEISKMEEMYLRIQKERNGTFSGEPGDQYGAASVKVMVTTASNEDAAKFVRIGTKGGDLAKQLTSNLFEGVTDTQPMRAQEAKARGVTVLVAASADGNIATMTVLIPNIKGSSVEENHKICHAFEVSAKKFGVRVERVAVHEMTPKTFRYVEKLEKVEDRNTILKQGRLKRSIRDLMGIEEVEQAGLRIEEAVVAYLYTGPLFQVGHLRLVLALFLVHGYHFVL